jgi:hypothetical protein
MTMLLVRRVGLFVSVAAVTALLSAPLALADDGHGGRHGDGDGDDRGTVVVVQNDRNEDVNEDLDDVQVMPQPVVVDNDQEVNDLNDDDD